MQKLTGTDLTHRSRKVHTGGEGRITLTDPCPGKRVQELCSPSSEQMGSVTSLMRSPGVLMEEINLAFLLFFSVPARG